MAVNVKDTRDPELLGKAIKLLCKSGMTACEAADCVEEQEIIIDVTNNQWRYGEGRLLPDEQNGKYHAY